MNPLILGDNWEVLKRWNSESVDLIYLDPPFFFSIMAQEFKKTIIFVQK